MSSKAFHSMGCMKVCLWRTGMLRDRLETFSLAYPCTGRYLKRVNTFKYLGSTLEEDGELDAEFPTACRKVGRTNWKRMSGVFGD